MNQRLYLDIHVLQTLPPSCVNRDDTGSPKTAVYGGVTRARVSSQCWKHAMREMFKDQFPAEMLAKRTKRIVSLVAEEITALDASLDAKAEALAKKALDTVLKIKEKTEDGTGALFFISNAQTKAVAKIAVDEENGVRSSDKELKEKLYAALTKQPGIDVALFGRMVADDPSMNNDACAQVAHSISTHKVHNEADYFTAVDDCSAEDNAGAGHIGTVEFNSSTMYRYATIAVHELKKQLGDETAKVVRGFTDAFVRSMPTGKQNTFANRTLPDMVYVCARTDQPINMAGAFERPIVAANGGYAESSKARLAEYAESIYRDYTDAPAYSFGVGVPGQLTDNMPLKDMLAALETLIEKESANV